MSDQIKTLCIKCTYCGKTATHNIIITMNINGRPRDWFITTCGDCNLKAVFDITKEMLDKVAKM